MPLYTELFCLSCNVVPGREGFCVRILVVCQYYDPDPFATGDVCRALAARGHMVTVLSGLPSYATGEIPGAFLSGLRRDEQDAGVRVLRVFTAARKTGVFRRALCYLSYALCASWRALFMQGAFDIVLVYQLSPVLMALPGLLWKRRHGTPLYLYCLDLWPESAKEFIGGQSLAYRLIRRASTAIYRACTRIGVSSRTFVPHLSEGMGIPQAQMDYIPQYADGRLLAIGPKGPPPGAAQLLYAGNLGYGQVLEVVLQALLLLPRGSFHMHFVGDGARREALQAMCGDMGLQDAVTFHGRVPLAEMTAHYDRADALLLTLRGDNEIGLTMPGKLQAYMSAGRPIFGAMNGAGQEVILEAGCGGCVGAGDAQGLAGLLLDFIQSPAAYAQCGALARAFFLANFTKEHFLSRLEDAMRGLTGDGEGTP